MNHGAVCFSLRHSGRNKADRDGSGRPSVRVRPRPSACGKMDGTLTTPTDRIRMVASDPTVTSGVAMPYGESNDPNQGDACASFASSLRGLRRSSEESLKTRLSLDTIAAEAGVARTTARAWIVGERCPLDDEAAEHIVSACGAGASDTEKRAVLQTWRQARNRLDRLRDERNRAKHQSPRNAAVNNPSGEPNLNLNEDSHSVLSRGMQAEDLATLEEQDVIVTKFSTNSDFYGAALAQAQSVRKIRATYVRQHPPNQVSSTASAAYFAGLLDWARNDTERHHVRRIIGVPTVDGVRNAAMLDWVRQHAADTASILNYEVRIQSWTSRGDGLNMALMDEDVSFIAVSDGTRQGLWGGRVRSRFLNEMFAAFFDQLWHNLETVEDYLANIDRQDDNA